MFGVYIHFPYCRKRCPYCDFAVHARKAIPHARYLEAVTAELEARAALFPGRRAVSLYLGGGTPSLWDPGCVARAIAAVRARFALPVDAEVTLEANPDDLPEPRLEALRAAGVNRLSIGVESLDRRQLAVLGRLHGPEEATRAVRDARRAGFSSISLDLMFGLPGQTRGALGAELDELLSLGPDHVSAYGLTVEPRTAFAALAREGALVLPPSDAAAELYELVRTRLEAAGLQHHEISSWARAGHRAVHNTLYWTGGEYLGLGSSAHSFRLTRAVDGRLLGERFANARSVDRYLPLATAPGGPPLDSHETLDAVALEREAVWLGLRLIEGIDRAAHAARHGADPVVTHAAALERLEREGLVEVTSERVRLTRRGALFADEAGARFL